MPDAVVNFGYSTVATAPSPATTGTTLTVVTDNFQVAPFYAVAWPPGVNPLAANAEIIRVGAKSGTSWSTITRHAQGTTARSIAVGWQIMTGPDVGTLEQYAPSGIASARSFVSGSSQTVVASATAAVSSQTADTTYGNVGITVGAAGMTIVTPGKYRITGQLKCTFGTAPTVGNGMGAQITKNGTSLANFAAVWYSFLGAIANVPVQMVATLAAGDVIALAAQNLSGQTAAISSGSDSTFLELVLEAQ